MACDSGTTTFEPDPEITPVFTGISGTVYDVDSGKTLSGVSIISDPETVTAVSAADGSFVLSLGAYANGTYALVAEKTGYESTRVEGVNFSEGELTTVTINLSSKTALISGIVYNTKEYPLSDVEVTLINEESSETVGTVMTDENGAYTFEDLSKTNSYSISFRHPESKYCTNEKNKISLTSSNVQINAVLSGKPLAASQYLGSSSCTSCHSDAASQHNATFHADNLKFSNNINTEAAQVFDAGTTMSLDIDTSDNIIFADFALSKSGSNYRITINSANTYTVVGILGGKHWKESYLVEIDSQHFALPLAWSIEDGQFYVDETLVSYWFDNAGSAITPATGIAYEQSCVGCHATGLKVQYSGGKVQTVSTEDVTQPYLEANVGCERCHGPGSMHEQAVQNLDVSDSLYIVQPTHLSVKNNTQVCGQCHTKGTSTKYSSAQMGYPVDENGNLYRPGNDLDEYWTADDELWSGTAHIKSYPQGYSDYKNSVHYKGADYNPRCSDCHDAHGNGQARPSMLKHSTDDNALCLSCHESRGFSTEYTIRVHTQHTYDPAGTGASRCTGCHMTKTGVLANLGDVGGHSFIPVKPETSLAMLKALQDAGETSISENDIIPNACTRCHNDLQAQAELSGETINVLAGDVTSEEFLNLLIDEYENKYEVAKPAGTLASYSHENTEEWMVGTSALSHGKTYRENPQTCLNSCHGDSLQGGAMADGKTVPSCYDCHGTYPHDLRLELDGHGGDPWNLNHSSYYTDTDCKTCHGADYTGGVSGIGCDTCHATPGDDFGVFNSASCSTVECHGTPPISGTHSAHFSGEYKDVASSPVYGDVSNYSTEDNTLYGCGVCHSTNTANHLNGAIDVLLYEEGVDSSSIKALMSPEASYNAETKTCSNVYCHSYTEYTGQNEETLKVPFPVSFTDAGGTAQSLEDQIAEFNGENFKTISSYYVWNHFKAPDDKKEQYYWSMPSFWDLTNLCDSGSSDILCQGGTDANDVEVHAYDENKFAYKINYPESVEINEVRRYKTTPAWDSAETLDCGGCHGYPPRSYLTKDKWSAADPQWNNGAPTILSEAAIDKHSFVIPKLKNGQTTTEVGHMANMRPFSNAPLRCQVCHYNTVDKVSLYNWENGEGWHLDDEGLVVLDGLELDDRSSHVNGNVDVNFDNTAAATTYRFNNEDYPYTLREYPEVVTSSNGMSMVLFVQYMGRPVYYGIKGSDAPGASWNPASKTCSNVSCHLEQTSVQWTTPYRPNSKPECYQCHQYYSDPTMGEDETMCWPHSSQDGCEYKEFILMDMEIQLNSQFFGP